MDTSTFYCYGKIETLGGYIRFLTRISKALRKPVLLCVGQEKSASIQEISVCPKLV